MTARSAAPATQAERPPEPEPAETATAEPEPAPALAAPERAQKRDHTTLASAVPTEVASLQEPLHRPATRSAVVDGTVEPVSDSRPAGVPGEPKPWGKLVLVIGGALAAVFVVFMLRPQDGNGDADRPAPSAALPTTPATTVPPAAVTTVPTPTLTPETTPSAPPSPEPTTTAAPEPSVPPTATPPAATTPKTKPPATAAKPPTTGTTPKGGTKTQPKSTGGGIVREVPF